MSRGPWHTRKQIRRGKARGRAGDGPPPDAAPPCGRVRWRDRGPTKQPPRLFSQQAAARRPRSPPTRPHVSVSPIGRREKGTAPAKRAPPSPSPRHGEVSRQQLLRLHQGRHIQVRCLHDPRPVSPAAIASQLPRSGSENLKSIIVLDPH